MKSICLKCESEFEGSEWFLTIEIRSVRIHTQIVCAFCSKKCRETWWNTPEDKDLLSVAEVVEGEDMPDPIHVHKLDTAVGVFRMHRGNEDQPHWVDKEGHAFSSALDINPWWKTDDDSTLKEPPVRCSRNGGFHFTEVPPDHMVGPVKLPFWKRVWNKIS